MTSGQLVTVCLTVTFSCYGILKLSYAASYLSHSILPLLGYYELVKPTNDDTAQKKFNYEYE
jgi:hypothetical protein